MARNLYDATPAELAILLELWRCERATVRQLTSKLYPHESVSDLATVQKLLKRLEDKQFVGRVEGAWPLVFMPTVVRDTLIQRRLQQTANELCSGELWPLLDNLLRPELLTEENKARLLELLPRLQVAAVVEPEVVPEIACFKAEQN